MRDAAAIAEMWNESDGEWPGTWNSGVPTTARDIREWHEKEEYTAVFVWAEGEKIGGYCSLVYDKDDSEALYLALLNVSPRFQGRSIGRQLLVRSVEMAIEDKKYHLDLDTWSGNVKAMAPYKRTGSSGTPEAGRSCATTCPRSWRCPVRGTSSTGTTGTRPWNGRSTSGPTMKPGKGCGFLPTGLRPGTPSSGGAAGSGADEAGSGGAGSGADEAESAGDRDELTVRVDREARHVTAVETADLSACATVDDIEPVRGGQTVLRWKLENRKDAPAAVSLTAKETGDLSIDYHCRKTLGPGETVSLEAPVSVSAKAETVDVKKTAPRVRTSIRWDDLPIDLATGIRPRVEMSFSIDPGEITLAPGAPRPVRVTLHSQLAEDVEAQVRITASDGLSVDRSARTVAVPARGYGGFETILEADRPGVFGLTLSGRLEREGKPVDLADAKHAVFALAPGGLLYHQDGAVRFENEIFRANLVAEGGQLKITDRATGRHLGTEGGRPIPPKWPSEYSESDFKLKAEGTGTAWSSRQPLHPGRPPASSSAGSSG